MSATTPTNIVPIFTSRGDVDAFLSYPYLFNRQGEWIGWVTSERDVYSVIGAYVGKLSNDPRIIRKRSEESRPHLKSPPAPPRLRVPASVPLPKMMADLSYEYIDVLGEDPELLHTMDSGDFRQDIN